MGADHVQIVLSPLTFVTKFFVSLLKTAAAIHCLTDFAATTKTSFQFLFGVIKVFFWFVAVEIFRTALYLRVDNLFWWYQLVVLISILFEVGVICLLLP